MNKFDAELERKILYKKGAPIDITVEYLFKEMDEAANSFRERAESGGFLVNLDEDPFDTPEQEHLLFIKVQAATEGKIGLLKDLCKMMNPDMLETISEHFKSAMNVVWNVSEPTSAISEWDS